MGWGQGRRKPFEERSLVPSRVRTGKKGRNQPRKRSSMRSYSPATRTQPTTGRIDFEENGTEIVKVFTPVD